MPDTRLILHVKGTEAETAELPKEAVRAAISEGKISQSQLIWSPTANAWKQVREFPDLLSSERLILHVKGTETETTELPKQAVRAAISEGKITHSQLIWSPAANAWKQVRELPDLLPSQKLAPSPFRVATVPIPKVADASIPESPTGPVARAAAAASMPQVRVVTASAPTPQARVAATPAPTPQVRVAAASAETPTARAAAPVTVRTAKDLKVKEEDDGAHPLKWLCIGLGALIVLVLGANTFLVDLPLASKLAQTPYSNVTAYAHFGAFMQPNVVVIHIPVSSKITSDNLADFIVALAHSTPQSPISRDLYERVALTSGWTAQYSFSGGSWKQVGDLGQEDEAQRKEFLLAQMDDASGEPVVPESTLNEAEKKARRDQAWAAFVAQFTAKHQKP